MRPSGSGGFVKFSTQAPRLPRRPHHGRHPPAPPQGKTPDARSSTTGSTAMASGSSSRTGSATSRCSMPPGWRGPIHPHRRPGRRASARQADTRPAPPVAAGADDPGHPRRHRPYAIDTIEPPFDNPWKAPLFFGDHDFFPDGTAMICTMQGDVWRVEGIDADARPRALAAHCLGLAPGARAWWSPRARFMFSAATRSPGSTTSTATARPTSTNASATPT